MCADYSLYSFKAKSLCKKNSVLGVTMVELLVISGIIALVMASMLYQYSTSAKTDKKLSSSQLLEQNQTILMERLKRDIRSSIKMEKQGDSYSLYILTDENGPDNLKRVEWRLTDKGDQLVRDDGRVKKYDFQEFIDGNSKIVFKIE